MPVRHRVKVVRGWWHTPAMRGGALSLTLVTLATLALGCTPTGDAAVKAKTEEAGPQLAQLFDAVVKSFLQE